MGYDTSGMPPQFQPISIGERTSSISSFASFNIFKRNKLKKLKSAPPTGIQTSSSMISLPKDHNNNSNSSSSSSFLNFQPKNYSTLPKNQNYKQHLPLQEKDSSATIKNERIDNSDVESVNVGSDDRHASDEESQEDDDDDSPDDEDCIEDDTPNEDTSMGSLGEENKIPKNKIKKRFQGNKKPSIQS